MKKLIASSRYSDNVNAIGYSWRELDRISEVLIKAFKKKSLFDKPFIEPFSQREKVDVRLKGESATNTMVYR